MEIIVQGYKIDTKDIYDIVDVEKHKTMFLNREAGFIVKMVGGVNHTFKESIPYESYPSEISKIKSKWRSLERSVREKWQQDSSNIEVFKL